MNKTNVIWDKTLKSSKTYFKEKIEGTNLIHFRQYKLGKKNHELSKRKLR